MGTDDCAVVARVPGDLHDLRRGRAAYNRIVNQQDVLAVKLTPDRIQLAAHVLFTRTAAASMRHIVRAVCPMGCARTANCRV